MSLLAILIDLYSIVVLVAVVLSWARVSPRHPVAAFFYALTEPVLEPLRRALPSAGGLDFSPAVLLLVLRLLRSLV